MLIFKDIFPKHQNSVHSEEKLECNECDEKFTRKFALKRHIKDIHLKLKYYCKICGQHYPRKDTLKIHYKKWQDRARTDDKNVEDEMTKIFADNAGQYQNQFKEYSSKEICHQCSKAFTNISALKTHISDVHSSGTCLMNVTLTEQNLKRKTNSDEDSKLN